MPVLTPPVVEPGIDVRISPGILGQLDESLAGPWVVILYNDDYHSFDEVILQVQKATGCSVEKAAWITMEAHCLGRAIAYTGSREECDRVSTVLKEIRLQVELDRA